MDKPESNKPMLALFGTYLLVLIWAVLWKLGVPVLGSGALRTVNLIPFVGAQRVTFQSILELLYNLVLFMPFGLYASLLAPKRSLPARVFPIFLTSLALETLQFILAIGRSDVTDLIVNTLGGAMGIAAYALLHRMLGKRTHRVALVVCAVGTALALMGAGYFFTHLQFREPV